MTVAKANIYMADSYMALRGPANYAGFDEGPRVAWEREIQGQEFISDLRNKLRSNPKKLEKPQAITVSGTLFPCALLSSGWWDRKGGRNKENIPWKDDIQRWLFHGFDEWGPSWDFSWDFENWEKSRNRPFYIAQIADGDEANSLPVLIPKGTALAVQEYLGEEGSWGGFEADVSGVLGHRSQFAQYFSAGALEPLGGFLDYCLWIDPEDPSHGISPRVDETGIYSGYLWRCVAPKVFIKGDQVPSLNEVFFIWEHTNFASKSAVKYNLDSLESKEEFLCREYGDLVLVQKSSSFVPGRPAWSQDEIYSVMTRKPQKLRPKLQPKE